MIHVKILFIIFFANFVYLCHSQQIQEGQIVNKKLDQLANSVSNAKKDLEDNANIQKFQPKTQKTNVRVSLNEDSMLNISPPLTGKKVLQQNNPIQPQKMNNLLKDKTTKETQKQIINVNEAKPSQNTKEVKDQQSPSEQIQIKQKKVQKGPKKQQIDQKNQGQKQKQNIKTPNKPVLSSNDPKIPIVSNPEVEAPRKMPQPNQPQKQINQNERLQKERLVQQWKSKQQQLANRRAEIIQKRQEQIKRIQEERIKAAQLKNPSQIQKPSSDTKKPSQIPPINKPSLKPKVQSFYCGQQIYQSRRGSLPQIPNARERLVSTVYGFNMYVDSKDYMVSNSITVSGTWEPGYINLIGHLVKPGDNVLNLGSQSGLQALVMGKIIGETGKLFIFEPYSFSNNLITKNIQLNNLQSITTIYKYGASDQKTTATIQISYSNTGGSEIVPSSTVPKANQGKNPYIYQGYNEIQQVQIDKVDVLLPKDIQLNFALLDVEKMEIKALKGMKQIIERSPNLVIMTEWQYGQNPRRNKQETVQFLNYMIDRGYKIYSYTGGNIITCSVGQFHQFQNIQALLGINFIDVFFIPKDYIIPH